MKGPTRCLKAFIALVGMRDIGEGLKGTLEGFKKPGSFLPTLWGFTRDHFGRWCDTPVIPVANPMLRPMADSLGRRIARFGRTVEGLLIANREAILDRQYIQERIADAAIALVTAACTLSRWDLSITRERDDARRAHRRRALPPHGQPPVRRIAQVPEQQ